MKAEHESYREQSDLLFTFLLGGVMIGIAALAYSEYPTAASILFFLVIGIAFFRLLYECLLFVEKLRNLRQGRNNKTK